ncbi:MAG: class II fructose-bisphosphatase [Candidatus Nomurabacteria bacterium]|jgi:fructose-1,6-bisphosphatase class II|nr:class II fructose-bisphosphatase [Candidatus Nomurabacteria bacterium]
MSALIKLIPDLQEAVRLAAIAAAPWRGKGDKQRADQSATGAMRAWLQNIEAFFEVKIGEGERDECNLEQMLWVGERLGKGGTPLDLAVDPLEGTTPCASLLSRSWTTLAAAPEGTLFSAPDCYMDKVATGPKCAGEVSIDYPPESNIRHVADALGKPVRDVVVCILNRGRNKKLIERVRATGASIHLIEDGDVYGCIATAFPELGIDLYLGIGAAPEGVLAATALKGLGGEFQGRLWFSDDELGCTQKARAIGMGHDVQASLSMAKIVKTDDMVFVACGVTDGEIVKGVKFNDGKVITETLVITMNGYQVITDVRAA